MRTVGKILMLILASVLIASPAMAAKTIKLHHLNQDDPFDNPTGAMATVFKSLVEAGTNGGITVQTFPNGQLGKDNEVLEQVKIRRHRVRYLLAGRLRRRLPADRCAGCPVRIPEYQHNLRSVRWPVRTQLAADIKKKTGMTVLGFGDSGGFFHITNNKKPITSPADMVGLKIRTMGLDTHKAYHSVLGGQPTALPGRRSIPRCRPAWPTAK